MAGTGRLAARRKARLLPTGRVAHGLAQRSRAVHPLPPPRLETEQRSSPPPLPPPCAVRPTRRHSAPRHCSTWGPTAASAAAAAAGPTAAAPFQIRLGRDPRRRVAGLEPPITIPGDRDPRLRHLLAGTHTYGAGTHSCHSTARVPAPLPCPSSLLQRLTDFDLDAVVLPPPHPFLGGTQPATDHSLSYEAQAPPLLFGAEADAASLRRQASTTP